jgi:hypothetical protein
MSGIYVYNSALQMTGTSLEGANVSAKDFVYMAQRFPDVLNYFGFTLESLGQTQAAFYDHFFTEEERAIRQRDEALASISAWNEDSGIYGDAKITDSGSFRTYVEGLNLLDMNQQDAYMRAMQAVPAFIALDEALATLEGTTEEASMSIKEFIESITPESVLNKASFDEMTELFATFGQQLPKTSDALYDLVIAGAFTDEQMQELAKNSEELGQAFEYISEMIDFIDSLKPDLSGDRALQEMTVLFESFGQQFPQTAEALYALIQAGALTEEQILSLSRRSDDLTTAFETVSETFDFIDSLAPESATSDLAEMRDLFASWGIQIPQTSDSLYDLIRSGALTWDQIRALVTKTDELTAAFEVLENTMTFVESLKPAAQASNEALQEMAVLFASWGLTHPDTSEALYELIQAGALTEDQIRVLAQESDMLTTAFEKVANTFAFIDSLTPATVAAQASLEQMTALFASWGMQIPQTSDALYELVQSGALTWEQMDQLASKADDLTAAFEELNRVTSFVKSLQSSDAVDAQSLSEMQALFESWGLSLPSSSDALYALIQAGALTNEQILKLANSADTLSSAFSGLDAKQQVALSMLQAAYDNSIAYENDQSAQRVERLQEASAAAGDALREASNKRIEALNKANEDAVNALNKAHELRVDGLNDKLSEASEALSDFTNIIDSSLSGLRSLLKQTDGVDETRQRMVGEAYAAINLFKSTGKFPDTIDDTISNLSEVDPNDFASRADWEAAISENSAALQALMSAGQGAKTEGQQQVELLEQQIDLLEEYHQAELDKLQSDLDTSIKAEQDNLERLLKAEDDNLQRLINAEEMSLQRLLRTMELEFDAAKATLMSDTNLLLNVGNGLLQQLIDSVTRAGSTTLPTDKPYLDTLPSVFNEEAYLKSNPDVAAAVDSGEFASGLDHYLNSGATEGRSPSGTTGSNLMTDPIIPTLPDPSTLPDLIPPTIPKPTSLLFDEAWYLQNNPDVAEFVALEGQAFMSGDTGEAHYREFGLAENRAPNASVDALFNAEEYLNRYAAEADAMLTHYASALDHYLQAGFYEGRIPGFAAGGEHLGGLRIVGERGPELEYTGPSSITPNHGIGSVFREGNAELHEEMRALREEVKALRQVSASQAISNAELLKIHKRWNGEGMPPDRMDYQKTTAEAV